MTVIEAYRVLGLDRYTHTLEIERTYKSRIQNVHLRLVTGQPQPVREKAQHDLMALSQAKEVLMRHHGYSGSPSARVPRKSPAGTNTTAPCPFFVIAAAFMIAASITTGIAVVCFKNGARTDGGLKPNPEFAGGASARVLITANQPCDVGLDFKLVGQDSAMLDLNIKEGNHLMVFRHRGTELSTTINVASGRTILIDVDFEKKRVQVK